MADALSRKTYCNHLLADQVHSSLVEEFQKLNLQIVPQGFLATLVIEPTLEEKIRKAQLRDAGVKNIKANMHKPKYQCFRLDAQGTLFFEDRIVVPKLASLR